MSTPTRYEAEKLWDELREASTRDDIDLYKAAVNILWQSSQDWYAEGRRDEHRDLMTQLERTPDRFVEF